MGGPYEVETHRVVMTYGAGPTAPEGKVTCYRIVDAKGRAIADTSESDVIEVHEQWDADESGTWVDAWDEAGRVNADRIVRALNSHEALVAVAEMTATLASVLSRLPGCTFEDREANLDLRRKAEAALAVARGC